MRNKKDKELMRNGLAISVVGGLVGNKGIQSVGAVAFTLGAIGMALNKAKKPKDKG